MTFEYNFAVVDHTSQPLSAQINVLEDSCILKMSVLRSDHNSRTSNLIFVCCDHFCISCTGSSQLLLWLCGFDRCPAHSPAARHHARKKKIRQTKRKSKKIYKIYFPENNYLKELDILARDARSITAQNLANVTALLLISSQLRQHCLLLRFRRVKANKVLAGHLQDLMCYETTK